LHNRHLLMKISRIYWFAHYNMKGPCVRYRGKYFLEQFSLQYNIPYTFIMPGYHPRTILRFTLAWFSGLFATGGNPLIVFQKIYTNGIYANALKVLLFFRRDRTIYDIDDAYYLKFPPATMHHFLRNCHAVFAASGELERYSGRFSRRVYVAPSPVIAHAARKKGRNPVLTIGWIGFYNAHRESFLRIFLPVLTGTTQPLRIILFGVTKREYREELTHLLQARENIRVEMPEATDWQDEESVYRALVCADIGIAPLIDNEFNRAKSAFKLKQYLSCGIPVLGSRVGENMQVIEEGGNGFFCDTPEEYLQKINLFREMPEAEYRRYTDNALRSSARFSMDEYCRLFMENLDRSFRSTTSES
jgi:glycosyltransferase involved in cell wall biosynthesis